MRCPVVPNTLYMNYETRRHAAFMVFMKLDNETVIFSNLYNLL